MIILSIHNQYLARGGEDESTDQEIELLRSYGHTVTEYREHNDRIFGMSPLRAAGRTVWSGESYRVVRSMIRRERPDVVHVQNFFPLVSPSVYYAARRERVPVVHTLRNYRLFCPNGLFLRQGSVCEDCLGKAGPLHGVVHGCYRGSSAATAAAAGMILVHRALRTWTRMVDVYVALTEFARSKAVAAGIPGDQIVVKPNFVPRLCAPGAAAGGYALFVGRLSEEKGVRGLLRAWRSVPGVPLRIVGDGPLQGEMARYVEENGLGDRVTLAGRKPLGETVAELRGARFLVFPSIWYETFGRVAVEAFACGVPVLAARIGAIAEVVMDGETGILFTPGDADELASGARWMWTHSGEVDRMGAAALRAYEAAYTPERNYEMLCGIYRLARARCLNRGRAANPADMPAGDEG
jgi:glycosyltransferase involved in cell wall biosynthesis